MRAVSITRTDCGATANTSLAVTGELIEKATILAPIVELILRKKWQVNKHIYNGAIHMDVNYDLSILHISPFQVQLSERAWKYKKISLVEGSRIR
jgi:hypothetical protein